MAVTFLQNGNMVKKSIKRKEAKMTWQDILAITLMIVNNIRVSPGPLNRLSDQYRGDYRNNMCHIQDAAPRDWSL
jgi:hypothetical protein